MVLLPEYLRRNTRFVFRISRADHDFASNGGPRWRERHRSHRDGVSMVNLGYYAGGFAYESLQERGPFPLELPLSPGGRSTLARLSWGLFYGLGLGYGLASGHSTAALKKTIEADLRPGFEAVPLRGQLLERQESQSGDIVLGGVTSSLSSVKRWTTPRCTRPTSFESSLIKPRISWRWVPVRFSSSLISRSTRWCRCPCRARPPHGRCR